VRGRREIPEAGVSAPEGRHLISLGRQPQEPVPEIGVSPEGATPSGALGAAPSGLWEGYCLPTWG